MVHCWAVQFGLILWTIHAYLGWQAEPYGGRITTGRKAIVREKVTTERSYTGTRSPGGSMFSRGDIKDRGIGGLSDRGLANDLGDFDRDE